MNLSKREFLQVLSAASVAGMGLGRFAEASAQTAADGLYDIPRFGNVSFLHMTDCHAQLRPIYFREPSVNLGVGDMKGRLPHLVGEHLLKAAGVRCDGFAYLDRFRMGEHLVYFRRIVDWATGAGVPLVLVDMPVTAELDEGLHTDAFAQYRAWLARTESELGLRVLRADRRAVGLSDAEFADFIHLNGAGALRLSAWLRGQLDESLHSVRAEVQP